jgi:hypothetical protein
MIQPQSKSCKEENDFRLQNQSLRSLEFIRIRERREDLPQGVCAWNVSSGQARRAEIDRGMNDRGMESESVSLHSSVLHSSVFTFEDV